MFHAGTGSVVNLANYGIDSAVPENMCPKDYTLNIDTHAWGACLCWERGGRRSKNGLSPACVPMVPVLRNNGISCEANDNNCQDAANEDMCEITTVAGSVGTSVGIGDWCGPGISADTNQVCPFGGGCTVPDELPSGNTL